MMNHFNLIQKEFSKIAVSNSSRCWTKMTMEQQKRYLEEHPNSKKNMTGKPSKRKRYRVKPKFRKRQTQKKFNITKTHKTMMLV